MTGVNKGVGQALAQRWLEAGYRIIATTRTPGSCPNGVEEIPDIDLADPPMIDRAAARIQEDTSRIDWLVMVSGTLGLHRGYGSDEGLDQPNLVEEMEHTFRANALGPLLLARAFGPLLKASEDPRLVAVSTIMSSKGSPTGGGYYAYRTSKSALNMAMVTLSRDWPEVCVACVHPGWVRTDMGGPNATLSPDQSAEGLDRVIHGLSRRDTGRFFDQNGDELPW